jgi:putative FmdB family regulatory protein
LRAYIKREEAMPIYEYRCKSCRRKVSEYVKGFSGTPEVACSFCGSKDLVRLFSTFAMVRGDADIYDDILSDPELVNRMMANDPKAMVEWSRKMGGTEGEKTPEYQEMIERMERGESMESVASAMQGNELGGADSASSDEGE